MTSRTFRSILRARGVNRIVLLRRRNAPCPEELTETLKGLWHSVEEVRDTLNALAAVCVVVRSERPRITLGLEPDNRVAFVYSDLEWADDPESGIPELLAFLKIRKNGRPPRNSNCAYADFQFHTSATCRRADSHNARGTCAFGK